jgi:hypothetical protein
MTPGVPGAGIGGLFYLASTLVLPLRRLARRLRRQPDSVSSREIWHNVAMTGGVLASLWATGWLLTFVVPDEALRSVTSTTGSAPARNVLAVATFATAVGTLLMVLGTVEIARMIQARRDNAVSHRGHTR